PHMARATTAANPSQRQSRSWRRWFADAIIAGFVAIGTSTAVLMIAYVLANGAADSRGDLVRQWLWQLTHNNVVSFSRTAPALAIVLHVVLGLIWALVYGLVEPNRSGIVRAWLGDGPGWLRGM